MIKVEDDLKVCGESSWNVGSFTETSLDFLSLIKLLHVLSEMSLL